VINGVGDTDVVDENDDAVPGGNGLYNMRRPAGTAANAVMDSLELEVYALSTLLGLRVRTVEVPSETLVEDGRASNRMLCCKNLNGNEKDASCHVTSARGLSTSATS